MEDTLSVASPIPHEQHSTNKEPETVVVNMDVEKYVEAMNLYNHDIEGSSWR